jgi:hypothetical protein
MIVKGREGKGGRGGKKEGRGGKGSGGGEGHLIYITTWLNLGDVMLGEIN